MSDVLIFGSRIYIAILDTHNIKYHALQSMTSKSDFSV